MLDMALYVVHFGFCAIEILIIVCSMESVHNTPVFTRKVLPCI